MNTETNSNVENREQQTSIASILLHPFVKLVSFLNFGYAVYPTEPIRLENSEFITVDEYLIRVLHVKPEDEVKTKTLVETQLEKRQSCNRNSLTEEYWFTRWNKPLQATNRCSCSFRRSQRFSKLTEEVHVDDIQPTLAEFSTFDSPPTKIKDLETFVERLIQESLFEALQEYYMTKSAKSGQAYDNFAFVQSPDEVDAVVKRRIKKTTTAKTAAKNCPHETPKNNKPFVFLLHGIGSTADVWWNVITSLLSKGYEIAAPDMLGHGYSSAPNKRKAYKFKKLLEYTLAAFDNFALKDESRKFVVIGHSFGCSLATAIARYRSQQVVQLVLISGGGPTALSPPTIGNEISVFSNLQLLISPLLFCGMKRSLFYSTRGKHFEACDTDDSIPKYVLEYIDREQNWPEGDAAFHRRILIPTLLVHGLKDTQVTLVQECEMERTVPRAFLELIPTAGHMSILETPEQLSHMILCFVDWWAR